MLILKKKSADDKKTQEHEKLLSMQRITVNIKIDA